MKRRVILLMVAMVMALLVVGSGAAMAGDQSKGATAPKESSEPVSTQGARIATKTFSNSSPLPIPADPRATEGRAAPYPSEIEVSGFRKGSRITNVKVNLFGLSHGFPDDIDLLLVGPKGQNIILMSDVGGSFSVQNVPLSLADEFEDNGEGLLPDDQVLGGRFAPHNVGSGDPFPAPAPTPSTANKLSVFNGTNPNGTWKLFALDDEAHPREAGQPALDVGELSGGWSLEITAKSKRHHH